MPIYLPNLDLAVEAQNSASNDTAGDVVGNKTDTVAGTSLVSLSMQTVALLGEPVADSAANATVTDVVGAKDDTIAGDSLMALHRRMLDGAGAVYVVTGGAAGVTLTAGAAGYTNPANWTQINAGAGVTVDSAIVGIAMDSPSDGAILGEIDVGIGAGDPANPVVTIPFEVASDAAALPMITFPPAGRVPAGTRIAARMRTAAGAETMGLKVLLAAIGD